MAFTNFCCRSGGSNLNAGTRTGDTTEPGTTADLTYASGSWVESTGVFTVASGDPVADGVAVGDFASVYADGSTVTGFVGRVTARTTTTITVSLTAEAGIPPIDGTNTRTLKIGGAWQGPNGAEKFPFNFATGTLTNSSSESPRVNFKNDQTYSITAAMLHQVIGPLVFQGYTSSYGDLGRATIDGGTTGPSYTLLTLAASGVAHTLVVDMIFKDNGETGSSVLVDMSLDSRAGVARCVFRGSRSSGCRAFRAIRCEAYGNNLSNTSSKGGFEATFPGALFSDCISHDNTGTNSAGFYSQQAGTNFVNCIADTNGGNGFRINNASGHVFKNCVAYNNGSQGIEQLTSSGVMLIDNCILDDNGGYGIQLSGNGMLGMLNNNAFFSNTSGETNNVGGSQVSGSVTLTGDPFLDPANGDFRLNNTAGAGADCRGDGNGTFTQTAASYAGTVGFPDIGAAQHQDSGGGGSRGTIIGG